MGNVCLWIQVNHHAGIEHPIGIEKRFEVAHDRVRFCSPFGFDEWRHVAPRSMFGLEGAIVFAADDFHHRSYEAIEMSDIGIGVEGLINQEVQVAVLGMPKYRTIRIAKI